MWNWKNRLTPTEIKTIRERVEPYLRPSIRMRTGKRYRHVHRAHLELNI